MKTALLFVFLNLVLPAMVYGSGAITIEITTVDSKISYTLHKRGYGDDSNSASPEDIEAWLRSVIPQIADPKLRIYIYTDTRTSFTEIMKMLRRLKAAGAKHFVVCVGIDARVRAELFASFDDIKIDFNSSSK